VALMELNMRRVACGYGGRAILSDISLTIKSGDFLCLLGPNGAGKTTLFKTVLGLLPPIAGSILADGEDVVRWSRRRRALSFAYVPQGHTPPFPFKVRDVVVMGRAAHSGPFRAPSPIDLRVAEDSLAAVGLTYLGDAAYTEVSGGERQLALIARALAQQPAFLFMDEPTAHLDYGNRIRILDHARALAAERGIGVVMITHEPNEALLYASTVATLDAEGRFATGAPRQIVTAELLQQLYGARVRIIDIAGPDGPAGFCVPEP
jgi:iron complex transport system ATP-binding protein